MKILYHISIYVYGIFLQLAAFVHPKAKKWMAGRRNWKDKLTKAVEDGNSWIWFHCASLGEFEQGRNLIEAIKNNNPHQKILLTFFSPSGYEVRKNYKYADYVCYLPLDTPSNAQAFLEIVQLQFAVFIKYELWLNYIHEISKREIPFLLVSARMQSNSPFLKSIFSSLYRKAFQQMAGIFTQDESTANLLESFTGRSDIMVTSDTRYDRVAANKEEFREIDAVSKFKGDRLCMVCGSTWPQGEEALFYVWEEMYKQTDLCMILAPHEINREKIKQWVAKYPEMSLRFSDIEQLHEEHRILWIDNIGMLSKLYYYADIAYVGGAWKTGLHNILEAVVFGPPVIIGPNYEKFPEADELIKAGGGFSIESEKELNVLIQKLVNEEALRDNIRRINERFIGERVGATEKVLDWCVSRKLINLSLEA